MVEVPLVRLAWAQRRPGNLSNIGLIARRAEWLPLLWTGHAGRRAALSPTS
jgi:hypothetical protein